MVSLLLRTEKYRLQKKQDIDEHGIGIKNIIDVISKYQGSYAIQNNENEFYFSIIIPH